MTTRTDEMGSPYFPFYPLGRSRPRPLDGEIEGGECRDDDLPDAVGTEGSGGERVHRASGRRGLQKDADGQTPGRDEELLMGIDVDQFRAYIVKPVLDRMDAWSPAAEALVIGTALQESDLRYVRQLGNGPALGVCQMECATYRDTWVNFLRYRPKLVEAIQDYSSSTPKAFEIINGGKFTFPAPQQLAWNLALSVSMCRVHYLRVPAALPEADDIQGLARYWKRYYNTPAGRGTAAEWMESYSRNIAA
ncbi:hypothetical protein CMI37_11275 [Candidatus Pacearchaeota archaeon]|nr:hypothetical protein [Candidatus Pacearchaeota archaeon]